MKNKRQWLITRILHVTAQLSQCTDATSKNELQAALALYTQALRDMDEQPRKPHYFS